MTTYKIAKDITIERQEGDTGNIEIHISPVFDLTDKLIRFHVYSSSARLILKKENADFVRNEQVITCQLTEADTQRKSGKHRWELEIRNTDGSNITTLGRGAFIIIPSILR
jgi:hypothetical protein